MSLTCLLRCADLDQTRAFYRDALGFRVADTAEGTLTVEQHGGKLIFTPQDVWNTARPACSGTFYFTVPDVQACHDAVKGKAVIAWPLQDMAHGAREFGITDCNGYHLAFQQEQQPRA